jgi:hypothetical protein
VRGGLDGMVEASRRPKSSPAQLPEEELCEIVRLKLAHPSWGRARSGNCIYVGMERWRAKAPLNACWNEPA